MVLLANQVSHGWSHAHKGQCAPLRPRRDALIGSDVWAESQAIVIKKCLQVIEFYFAEIKLFATVRIINLVLTYVRQ